MNIEFQLHGNVTTCILTTNSGDRFVGIAKLGKDQKYNRSRGENIAFYRARLKFLYKQRDLIRKATNKVLNPILSEIEIKRNKLASLRSIDDPL